MYKVINLKQGSDEWKQYRRWKICASDMSTIMGLNPWKTPLQLYQEKVEGIEPFVSDKMRRGVQLEPEARKELNESTGSHYSPICMEHQEHDFLFASLDAWDDSAPIPIAEIKVPSENTHRMAVLDYKIPDYYKPQIQAQMFIAGVDKAYYVSYMPEDLIPFGMVETTKDDDFCNKMLDAATDFYRRLLEFDPPIGKEKEVIVTDPQLILLAKERYQLKSEVDDAQERIDEIDTILKSRCTESSLIGKLKLTKAEREGAIDYKKMPEDLQKEVEKYRKPKYITWTIRQLAD